MFSSSEDEIGKVLGDRTHDNGYLARIMLAVSIERHNYFLRCQPQADLRAPYNSEIDRISGDRCAGSYRYVRRHATAGIIDDDGFVTISFAPSNNLTDSALLVARWNHCGDLQHLDTYRLAPHFAH
jgi:hypothetical protein